MDGKKLLQPHGRDMLAGDMGRKAFARCHLAPGVWGAGAGGEGENSFAVYPLVGRRRRLNWDQELVCKPGTFVTSAHRCKSSLKADDFLFVLGCTGNQSRHHQALSNVGQSPFRKQLYTKGFAWDCCSAAEGFVRSKGTGGGYQGMKTTAF